ncbi:MAG: hydratase [Gammaproteobacteria bacterium]|nr:hydratase [Gammaproteobacteria bacterium]
MSSLSIEIERRFSQDDFDAFARLSGDDNPIHVDPEFSAATRFGRPVAHGMLLYAVFRGLIFRLMPDAQQVSQDLMFTAPTYADEPVRFAVDIKVSGSGQAAATMSCTRVADDAITCEGAAQLSARPAQR